MQLSWQNKIRTNLCCNFPHKTKFGLTYVAIVKTNKIRINLCWTFFYKKKNNKNQAILQLFWQNKIRINLCCNFSHKTKFGSTYVAIFHTKQNSDQPMLQFSTQNKIRINLCCNFSHKTKFEKRALVCEELFQPRLVSTFLIILGSQDRTPFSKSNNG